MKKKKKTNKNKSRARARAREHKGVVRERQCARPKVQKIEKGKIETGRQAKIER